MSPGFFAFILHAGTVAALGLGLYLYFKLARNDLLSRVIAAVVPLAVLVQLDALLMRALRAPFWDWNAARLMPTFAITYGYKLYYEPNVGPEMNFMYGPMAAYAYLPATLAKTPTAAILTASFIVLISWFGPVLWLLLQQSKETAFAKLVALGAFVLFCAFSCRSSPLGYSGFAVHADAPALGLCACACAVLGLRKRCDSTPIFVVSGLLAALAVWTKQTMVPILPGLIAYVWLADGGRCALRYTLWIFVVGICVSLVFLALNDVRALIFNMFVKHLRHPWNYPGTGEFPQKPFDHLRFLLASARLLLHAALIPMIAVVAYAVRQYRVTTGSGLPRLRQWANQNHWLLPTVVGLAMITTSVVCLVGAGGDWNDLSPTVYFLAIGAALAIARYVTDEPATGPRLPQWIAKSVLLVLVGISTYSGFTPPRSLSFILQALPHNPAQQTYNLAKQHPGMIYFPGNPLSSLLAEGKPYHFLIGLHERWLDGYPPSREHFLEYMPPNMQLIVLTDPSWLKDYVEGCRPYLPQFSAPIRDPSGWFVYRLGR